MVSRLIEGSRSLGHGRRFGGLLQLFVIASLLLSMGSAAYAVSVPQQGETPTELSLLTENESGELTADGYPQTLRPTEEQTLYVGVTNREQKREKFTVVVTLDRVVSTGDTPIVIERAEITRFSRPLTPGQWWYQRYEIEPLLDGSNLRLTHHLYRGDAPPEVDTDDAYRVTHLWISGPEPSPSGNATQAANESSPTANESGQSGTDPVESVSESPQSGNESTGSDAENTLSTNESTEPDSESTASGNETTESDAESDPSLNESASTA